jgi:hypothetical protein
MYPRSHAGCIAVTRSGSKSLQGRSRVVTVRAKPESVTLTGWLTPIFSND